MEDYIKVCRWPPSYLNNFYNCLLLLYSPHISLYAMYSYYMYCSLHQVVHNKISYLVTIADCTNVGSATVPFEDLVTFTGEHYSR